ncbi:MAG: hypothetical protein EA367_17800 [Leptolyngbya sp. DLM2.Bin15]|nr:MAG: hypothetical protein EA367_17800 [Leptolyngbya sp. DLM2.Bin15]
MIRPWLLMRRKSISAHLILSLSKDGEEVAVDQLEGYGADCDGSSSVQSEAIAGVIEVILTSGVPEQ